MMKHDFGMLVAPTAFGKTVTAAAAIAHRKVSTIVLVHRLHREHSDKIDILIHDYVELDHPQLSRMWEKRQRGYRAMGYHVEVDQVQAAFF